MVSFSSSPSDSSTKTKKNKLSVKNQTRFKESFLLAREKTILKKALELTVLCDNKICVLHYDREGNLVSTLPEDQSQVTDILDKYRNLSDGEKLKKSTNLSQFYNKKLVDEKKRSLSDAEECKRFTKKVGEFKGSLLDQFHILKDRVRDLRYSQDHHHQTEQDQSSCLDVMSQENHNFPEASSYGFFPANDFSSSLIEEEDPLMSFIPHNLDQLESFTNLLMSGDHVSTITDQYLPTPAPSNHHQGKFSVFLFNHETATLTQLPNSASSSFDQGLIGTLTSY
ncbi:AGAMOUS-like 89 [Raphanus sativus]|uniref:Agamous-like MADS-box protein AGL53 n=1 Tax=Raphanus sativus TaxID=3726 RepID=A0A9W3C4X9_RAPSA|nr:agamous-like MADS-box protein AGL53 [Raphanus sativus]KAJ4917468.1 AGAMOUS-like 89 [Raphanus sativus]